MILERFRNNKNLLDSFNNILIDESKESLWGRPFCYINCVSMINDSNFKLMPIIGRPKGLNHKDFSNPNSYSIWADQNKRKLEKMCKNQKALIVNNHGTATIGISQETYNRIKKASEDFIKEILREIGNEYKGVGFKSEMALANAVDNAFLEIDEIYPENYVPDLTQSDPDDDYDKYDYNNYDDFDCDKYNNYDYDEEGIGDWDGDLNPNNSDNHDGPEW